MKINKIQNNYNPSYRAGLSSKIKQEIRHCDVSKITNEFQRLGIPADFKNNKVIAWCCLKSTEIIQFLNENYKLNLGLPRGIIVENFNILRNANTESDAFCSAIPAILYRGDDFILPENVIFINEYPEFKYSGGNKFWEKIDEYSDWNYNNNTAPSDSFLHIFLHEFSHVIHNKNILKQFGAEAYIDKYINTMDAKFLHDFQNKYGTLFSKLCPYAGSSPFEAIACDLGTRIINNLDKNSLMPKENMLLNSPYTKIPIIIVENEYDKIVRKLFNGNFD